MQKNKSTNHVITSWIWLIVLTIASIFLTSFIDNRIIYVTSALIIVVIKGQQIVDVFMELNKAPRFWRLLLLSYIVLIPLIIAIIYLV